MSDTPRLHPFYKLLAFDCLDSTNEEAKRRAEQGAAEGTLLWAKRQTAGRGRRGRQWISPPGNLYCSLVLRPDRTAAEVAQLGMVAAVATREILIGVLPPSASVLLKWPNDVLVNEKKAGGILLESAAHHIKGISWLVVGIGVNIETHPAGTSFPSTCLRREGGHAIGVASLLEPLCRVFHRWYDIWRIEGFAPVREAWWSGAWNPGKPIDVQLEGRRTTGIFSGLDDQGALVLSLPDGSQHRITAADIFALPQ
ncbi:MAG TPA: biotin--[acetyl-CoA-carboxylase] ligase [Alphaproteobacteria bacterium]|nr:biotin--[acetyl-CoA-carboxylase] ligase [Alphaproteobacteria bacterium]